MFFHLKVLAALLVLFAAVLAGDARAQKLSISLGKHGKHGSFAVHIGHSQPRCAPRPIWVPGHYEHVSEQVWVEGACRTEWVPAVYRNEVVSYGPGCERVVRVCVSPGYWRKYQEPGHYETRSVRVWVAGHWS